MDRYTDFIEKMRGSHLQMPHPEEVTGRILERIQTSPQNDCKTATALQKTPVIRLRRAIPALAGIAAAAVMVCAPLTARLKADTVVRTDISSLNMRTYAAMSRPDAQLEHYRKIKALRQSFTGLDERAAKPQNHEDRH
ncbi:MAG TPA: hypothetical protein IAC04_02710 [Candidatus Coprenecus stercoravium]|uniref:Uncharacterized protein n=1 Tax=Candidatus Coprenecus stercoravium TaxID=2840735 RepID=A0A9D2K8F2_9BACT|nr:hypothetical protein [Candidatus Coprenecus stercoravium]